MPDATEKKNKNHYRLHAASEEFRYIDGELRYWKVEETGEAYLSSTDLEINHIFRNAALCDGHFYREGLAEGGFYTGSDGTTLTFASGCETVDTACGRFEGCQL